MKMVALLKLNMLLNVLALLQNRYNKLEDLSIEIHIAVNTACL